MHHQQVLLPWCSVFLGKHLWNIWHSTKWSSEASGRGCGFYKQVQWSIQISLWSLAVVVLNVKLNRPCGSQIGTHVDPSYAPVKVKYVENVSVVVFPKQILISFFHTHICPRTQWSGQFVVRTKNDTHFHLHRLIVYYYKMLKDSNEKKIKLLKEQISMVSIMH